MHPIIRLKDLIRKLREINSSFILHSLLNTKNIYFGMFQCSKVVNHKYFGFCFEDNLSFDNILRSRKRRPTFEMNSVTFLWRYQSALSRILQITSLASTIIFQTIDVSVGH